MRGPIKKGTTDVSVDVVVIDSTDGTPETAVTFESSGIDLWYWREGGTKTAITEATLASVDAAHSDGGFIHVADGVCRLDLPDAAFAAGSGKFVAWGGTITGMIVIGGTVELEDENLSGLSARVPTTLTDSGYMRSDALHVDSATPLDAEATADAVLDEVVVNTYTLRQMTRIMGAILVGLASGGASTTLTFKEVGGVNSVVVMTVDASGNRSEVVISL
ncbi:MAG: hypothetical protein WC683_07880 [bacterium]